MADEQVISMEHYSAALDEIYHLRKLLAYEARVTEGTLIMASLPKSARRSLEQQVERMRASARGDSRSMYNDVPDRSWQAVMRQAGADLTLTRTQWETNHG